MLIVSVGVVLLILAGVLIVTGFRGQLINDHPHCAGCGFDLHGLDFAQTSRCPECGRLLASSRVVIRSGKRRLRLAPIALGGVLMLLGAAGTGWPAIKRIPSIQRINWYDYLWYDYLPEATLITLTIDGRNGALDALVDRLIPGKVSDAALQRLVAHAMAMLEDETLPWDPRWGDVLLYAFTLDKMSDADLQTYLENSVKREVQMLREVGPDMESLPYMYTIIETDRGQHRPTFRMQLSSVVPDAGPRGSPFQFVMRSYRPRRSTEPKPDPNGWTHGIGDYDPDRPGWWFPYMNHSGGSGSTIHLDRERDRFVFIFESVVSVYRGPDLVHEWTISDAIEVNRTNQPSYYDLLEDDAYLAEIAAAIRIPGILVPEDPWAAAEHEDIRGRDQQLLQLESIVESPLGLLGDLWVDNGEKQIPLIEISISSLKVTVYPRSTRNVLSEDERLGVTLFTNHEAFWARARQRGFVDVIYDPTPGRHVNRGHVDNRIDRSLIWRRVPVVPTTLTPVRVQQADGTMKRVMELSEPVGAILRVNGFLHDDAVQGELMDAPAVDTP